MKGMIIMKFEGNNMFSYDEVTEILKDNYFDREAVQIALMEKAMDGKDYDNDIDVSEASAYVTDIINRIDTGNFPICYEFFDFNEVLRGFPYDETCKIMMEGNFGMSDFPEPYFAQIVVNAEFDKNLDEKGVLLSSAVVGDINTEYEVPLMNMEIPYKNLTIIESNDINGIFSNKNYNRLSGKTVKLSDIPEVDLDWKHEQFERLRNEVKEVKEFFDKNNIVASFSETYEGVELKCYDRMLPEVDVYYNFDNPFGNTLSTLSEGLLHIEEKPNKAEMIVDLAEELMSWNDYENGIVEVKYIANGFEAMNPDKYVEIAEKELAHREKRIEAGEHDLNI
jgi:hypothetical protein